MAEIVVFHHALGLTAGIEAFGNALAVGGHDVVTPDLFGGETFDTVETGVAHAEAIGFGEIAEIGAKSVTAERVVVIGFSLGVLPAQKVAQERAGVLAAVLCHSAIPLGVFGDAWPGGVALQIHAGERDPFVEEDREAIDQLLGAASPSEVHWYDTDAHLFADVTSPEFDPALAGQLATRTLEFLSRLD